ncbi:hypothetical protein [Paenibacillus sp. P46E]|uniref:hypothetical protein n=1 Tax=Paenibacillus sp. P46E TaxID=1349436 RepID=UPI00093DDAF9|nr:hypothetical protein [Paenibacillus sp. P46E]OKP95938.1 hypothetical protein A3849_23615 [Paenibacillus sp. P46E]
MKNHERPRIITLCGSTKFKPQFEAANAALTRQGVIVLSLGFFEQSEGIHITADEAHLFEQLHYSKIKMSDGIMVIHVNGYIGESTRKEIEYARRTGKTVEYWESQ